jgi:hypothetical protein
MAVTPEYKVEIIEVRKREYIAKVTEIVWKSPYAWPANKTKTFYMGLDKTSYKFWEFELMKSKFKCFLQPFTNKNLLTRSVVEYLEGQKNKISYPRVVDTINI